MLEKGLKLLMIMLTINGVLLAARIVQVDSVKRMYGWMPGGLQSYGEQVYGTGDWNSEYSLERQDVNVVTSPEEESIISIGMQAMGVLLALWDVVLMMLTGFIWAMLAIPGMPIEIVFMFGIPIVFIEVITIFYLALSGLSALAGVFR